MAASGSLSPSLATRATELATLFSDTPQGQQALPSVNADSAAALKPPGAELLSLITLLKQTVPGETGLQGALERLLPLLFQSAPGKSGEPTPLQQLLTLLAEAGSESRAGTNTSIDGQRLQQVIDRLGIPMEQFLATGNRDEAVQTLKFALLELAQQLPAVDRQADQAGQMIKSIELYQLLQLRLAGEALFFLPLPFSFLNQGYILVDGDSSQQEASQKGERPPRQYGLHLKLEGLGNLQINIRQEGGRMNLQFLAEDAERAKFLAGHRAELEQWMTAATLESVQFLAGAEDPAKTLLARIVGGTTGMLDTTA